MAIKHSKKVRQDILARVKDGETVASICNDPNCKVPTTTIYGWLSSRGLTSSRKRDRKIDYKTLAQDYASGLRIREIVALRGICERTVRIALRSEGAAMRSIADYRREEES